MEPTSADLPILVFLPGMDGTGDLFDPILQALDRRFDSVIVRYPIEEPLDYAELLSIARAALPIDRRFVLVAESFSGPLGITIAAEAARGLDGLILCGSFARNPRPALAGLARCLPVVPINAATLRLAIPAMLGCRAEPSLNALVTRTVARVPAPVLQARLRAVLRVDVGRELAAVHVPILYLQAARDRIVPVRASKLILRIKPEAEVVPIDGPHFLLQANPEAAAAEIVRFAISTSKGS